MKCSKVGIGTTGYWSGINKGLDQCISVAYHEYGVNVFDSAEMYGNGRCEEALGKAIRSLPRERLFLVSKILPQNVTEKRFRQSLEGSLKRLGAEYIDLFLLHWREDCDLSFLVKAMEEAVTEGKILHWGVSNFDVKDIQDLLAVEKGSHCFCNQIYYSLYERGSEYELLPLLKENRILPMSYSSLGSGYHPHPNIHNNKIIMKACKEYGIAPEAMMLKMNQEAGFVTLFSTSSLDHLHANLQSVSETVYQSLKPVFDREYPSPDHAYSLVKI